MVCKIVFLMRFECLISMLDLVIISDDGDDGSDSVLPPPTQVACLTRSVSRQLAESAYIVPNEEIERFSSPPPTADYPWDI